MTDRKMTVLQVLPALQGGGVERGTVEIAGALVDAGHRALVASSEGAMIHTLGRTGAEHVPMRLHPKNPFTIWRNIRRLARLVREQNVDLVHARSRAPAWSACFAARRTGRPFVTTMHMAYGAENQLKRAYNSVMLRGDRVIAISHYVRDYALKTYPGMADDRIRVIFRGVDTAQFRPGIVPAGRMIQLAKSWALPEGAPVILAPARLSRRKGQALMIKALAGCNHPDAVMVFVGPDEGSDSFKAELQRMAAAAGVANRLHFGGNCMDMQAAYSLASVVAAPSIRPEGFGRVAVEAQAMGRPIIVSDQGGFRETVLPGETGWMIPTGDHEALAATFNETLSLTTDEREALSQRCVAHVSVHFTLDEMRRRTLAVYEEALRREA